MSSTPAEQPTRRPRFRRGEHVVVVGFGPVAARLVDELTPAVAEGLLRLTVVGQEEVPAYNRVLLAEHAVGRTPRALLDLADADALAAAGVELLLAATATSLDVEGRTLLVRDASGSRELAWDRLVLATGAEAVVPALNGLGGVSPDELPAGVTALRDLADAERVTRAVRNKARVLVLGGGVLGLETALALHEQGCRTTLAHHGDWLLSQVLSETTGRLLGRRLNELGLHTRPEAKATGVLRDRSGRVTHLMFDDGSQLSADLLVLSCGVRPRVQLAVDAGLPTSRGVLVDHRLEVGGSGRVFAIGDCAQVKCGDPGCLGCRSSRGPAGLIAPGWQQAEWLAARLLTDLDEQPRLWPPMEPHAVPPIRVKARDVELVAAGKCSGTTWQPRADGAHLCEWVDGRRGHSLRMVVRRDGTLSGLEVLGLPRASAEASAWFELQQPVPLDPSVVLRLDAPDGAGSAPAALSAQSTVCNCAGVSAGAILDAVAGGADSLEGVKAATRACSGCGTCSSRVQQLIDQAAPAPVAVA